MMDEGLDKENASEEPRETWTLDLEDANRWLKMLDHIEQRYQAGEKALADGKWHVALTALEEVAENDPYFRDVQILLAQARGEDQLAHWHDEASAYQEAGRWDEACRVWSQVLRQRADYDTDDALSGLLDALDGLLDQYANLEQSPGRPQSEEEDKEDETGKQEAGADAGEQSTEPDRP